MKPRSLWSGLQTLWQPRAAAPASPADERVVTDTPRVRRTLGELARLQSPLALQAADGGFIGGGVLSVDGADALLLHLRAGTAQRGSEIAWPLNATASGTCGLVLFTLLTRATGTPHRLCAPWPGQLILIQSRRHFRVTGWSYFSCRLVRFALKTRCTTSTYVSSTFGRSVFFVQIGALRRCQPLANRALLLLAIRRVRPLRSCRETPA